MARLDGWRRSSRRKALVRTGCPVLPWDPTPVLRKKIPHLLKSTRLYCWLVLVVAVACLPAIGQTDVNDVHVQPREVQKPEVDKAKEVARQNLVSTEGLSTHIRP